MKLSTLVLSALSLPGLVSATTEFYDYRTTDCTGDYVDRLVGDGYRPANTCIGIAQNKMSVKLIKADPYCSCKVAFRTRCYHGDADALVVISVSIHGYGLYYRRHLRGKGNLQAWQLAECEGSVRYTTNMSWRLLSRRLLS